MPPFFSWNSNDVKCELIKKLHSHEIIYERSTKCRLQYIYLIEMLDISNLTTNLGEGGGYITGEITIAIRVAK
jgi:hypothetical protein